MSARDVPTQERECASHLAGDLRGRIWQVHRRHDSTELNDIVELFGVEKRS